jgi:hypothetical protein
MLTTSTNAYPVFSFVDEGQTITTTSGSIIRLEIQTDEATSFFDPSIRLNGNATFTNAINKSDCADYGWDPTISYDPIYESDPTSVQINCHVSGLNSGPLVGYVEITYGSGQVIVSGQPFYTPPISDFSDGVVTIVPEPATLLLLAPGTLILLRKRRR